MATDDIRNDQIFHADCSFGGAVDVGSGNIKNENFSSLAADRLATAKQVHRHDISHYQKDGSDVVSETVPVRLCRGAGTLLGFEVRPITAPTGGDKQYTVDIQQAADASGSYATLLDSPITVDNTSVDETKQAATMIGSPVTTAGAAIQIVIAASGSTGSQGQGFVVTAYYEEAPS